MKSIENFGYAIFDMDGTLINSTERLDCITREFFRDAGVPCPPAFLLESQTMSKPEYISDIKKLTGSSASIQELSALIDCRMMDMYRNDVTLLPGVEKFLKSMAERKTAMCVASSTPEPAIRYVLDRLGVLNCFRFVISAEDTGRDKRFPDVFLAALQRLGAENPTEAIVFEDSPVAIQTAKKCGFYVAGVLGVQMPTAEDAKRYGCDAALRDFSRFEWLSPEYVESLQ